MAYDEDIKIKVRAYYECNDLSYPKVTKHFEDLGYEVSVKTVQAWGGNDAQVGGKWVKNKYASMGEAVEALLPPEVLESVTDSVKKTIVGAMASEGGGETITPEILDAEVEAVSEELIWQTLNKHSLMGKMAKNLMRAEKVAKVSTAIGVHATYHGMLTSAIGTLYGKKVEMVPQDPNNKILSDKELDNMSTEELQRLVEE